MSNKGCGCSGGGSRSGSKCGCGNDILSIPWGNAFRLHLCALSMAPGMSEGDFSDLERRKVYVVSWLGRKDKVLAINDGTELTLHFGDQPEESPCVLARDLKCTVYGIEITGMYHGNYYRWRHDGLFRIVNTNPQAWEQDKESLDAEDYWILDTLKVEDDEEGTMTFITHGHVTLDDGTLMIQGTENCDVSVEGDTLVFTMMDKRQRCCC